jgi:predicted nucleotidyltransferase
VQIGNGRRAKGVVFEKICDLQEFESIARKKPKFEGSKMKNVEVWEGYLGKIKETILSYYQDNLLAVAVFGSAARGDFQKGSDLDLLIVLRESNISMGKRIDEFMKMEWEIRKSPQYAEAKALGLPCRVEPIILRLDEFQNHPPILLDLTTDARILAEHDDIFSREMDRIRRRLEELGAKRIFLEGGRWYWILNPKIKWGEKVVL